MAAASVVGEGAGPPGLVRRPVRRASALTREGVGAVDREAFGAGADNLSGDAGTRKGGVQAVAAGVVGLIGEPVLGGRPGAAIRSLRNTLRPPSGGITN